MEAAIGHNSQAGARNSDWIAVYRGLRTHPVVGFLNADGTRRKGATVCQSMAWIDLCMEANWKDRRENNNGKLVLVERGQLLGGRAWLADRWGWTENQVRWFLKKLQDDGMILIERPKIATKMNTGQITNRTTSPAHFTNVIKINNYNTYQTLSELSELLDDQSNHQSNHQSTTNQPPHSNKETRKQERKEDNQPPPEPVAVRANGGSEISGLNGATNLIIEKLAGWINPIMPDRRTARASIENFVSLYGSDVVRDAFAKLEAKCLHGDIVARPIPYLAGECGRLKTRKTAASSRDKIIFSGVR